MQDTDNPADKLVRNERRGVWFALLVVIALAATLLVGADTQRALMLALAISIVFGVIWLQQQRMRGSRKTLRETRDVVMHDELRQTAIAHAYRWAFFAVLAALAGFCLLSSIMDINVTGQLVAALGIALAVTAFLVAFLLFDRA